MNYIYNNDSVHLDLKFQNVEGKCILEKENLKRLTPISSRHSKIMMSQAAHEELHA